MSAERIMTQLRQLRKVFLCMTLVLGLAAGGLAALGSLRWGDLQWYFHVRPAYSLRRGQEALRRDDWDRADRIARSLEASGHGGLASLLRGASLVRQGEIHAEAQQTPQAATLFAEALAELSNLGDQGENRTEVLALSGQCYLYLRDLRTAEQFLRSVLQEAPNHIDAHRGLAALYFDQGSLMRAVHHLEYVAELDPQDGRPHRFMGLIYKDLEKYPVAAQCYQESLRRDLHGQNRSKVQRELAQSLVKQGKYDRALEILRECDPLPEEAALVEALRANCLHAQGHTAGARAILDRALEAHADSVDLFRLRGQLYLESKEPALAASLLERALKIDRHDYSSRYQLVLAYQRLGRSADAEQQQRLLDQTRKDLDEMTRLSQEITNSAWDAKPRLRLAELCDKLEKYPEATMWREAAAACATR